MKPFYIPTVCLGVAFMCASTLVVHAQNSDEKVSIPIASTVSPITLGAVQSGVLTCTSRINQMSTFLTDANTMGSFVFLAPQTPDQKIFSASMELVNSNSGLSAYASESFAPLAGAAGGCGGVYDEVSYEASACSDVKTKNFKDLKVVGFLKQRITVLEAQAAKIFLMPAGDAGCVVIKKEIVQ